MHTSRMICCVLIVAMVILAVVAAVCLMNSSPPKMMGGSAARHSVSAPSVVHTLGSASEAMQLLMGAEPAMVMFYSDACGYCKVMKPVYESLAAKWPQVKFAKLDARSMSDMSTQAGAMPRISGFPTMLDNFGAGVNRTVGAHSEQAMQAKLEAALGPNSENGGVIAQAVHDAVQPRGGNAQSE